MSDAIFLLEDDNRKLLAIGEVNAAHGNISDCSDFIKKHRGDYIFGFISYDAKNQIESLSSSNPSLVDFPELYFCVPEVVIEINSEGAVYLKGERKERTEAILSKFTDHQESDRINGQAALVPRIEKEEYLEKVSKLQEHIQYGDIYEVTFCQEFYANNVKIDPFQTYCQLSKLTQAPFRCFVQHNSSYLMSGSPERFMKKKRDRIISQPIKGTSRRGHDDKTDQENKQYLLKSSKEKAENVMIVDLVRNDLSRIAKRNSVHVDELFGVYSFRTVHQLISTVSAQLKNGTDFKDILRAMFPMGSMTGAPKVSAMQLIEKYESFKRGMFSGSVGYISPDGDFDFNVVIRSILYDEKRGNISCPVGGAITIQSNPEDEYEECLLKAEALKKALNSK